MCYNLITSEEVESRQNMNAQEKAISLKEMQNDGYSVGRGNGKTRLYYKNDMNPLKIGTFDECYAHYKEDKHIRKSNNLEHKLILTSDMLVRSIELLMNSHKQTMLNKFFNKLNIDLDKSSVSCVFFLYYKSLPCGQANFSAIPDFTEFTVVLQVTREVGTFLSSYSTGHLTIDQIIFALSE